MGINTGMGHKDSMDVDHNPAITEVDLEDVVRVKEVTEATNDNPGIRIAGMTIIREVFNTPIPNNDNKMMHVIAVDSLVTTPLVAEQISQSLL